MKQLLLVVVVLLVNNLVVKASLTSNPCRGCNPGRGVVAIGPRGLPGPGAVIARAFGLTRTLPILTGTPPGLIDSVVVADGRGFASGSVSVLTEPFALVGFGFTAPRTGTLKALVTSVFAFLDTPLVPSNSTITFVTEIYTASGTSTTYTPTGLLTDIVLPYNTSSTGTVFYAVDNLDSVTVVQGQRFVVVVSVTLEPATLEADSTLTYTLNGGFVYA